MPRVLNLLNAGARAGFLVTRNIPYGPAARQMMDIYRPDRAAGPAPVLVWFYGGGWQRGERRHYRFLAAALASAGVVVAVPDYRLYPEVRFPAFIEDGARAVAQMRRLAASCGGDAAKIFVAGHSAGAYIAAMLALAPGYLAAAGMTRDQLAGAVGVAGAYDFLPIPAAFDAVFAAAADDLRQTQPIAHVDGRNPPLLLLHGDADRLCYPRNSLALAARVRAAGGAADARTYRFVNHISVVLAFSPLLRVLAPTLADTLGFVRRVLDKREARAISQAA